MVDTARFQLGIHAIRAVRMVLQHAATVQPVSPLLVVTYLPLDAQSVARIIDNLVEDGLAEKRGTDVFYHATQDEVSVEQGEHLRALGFIENLVQLRGDADWCRKVRDQHLVVRAIATLGTDAFFADLSEKAELPPARVHAVVGDLESEGWLTTTPSDDGLRIAGPDLEYPPERFGRNEALLSNVEARTVPVRREWWWALGAAVVLLAIFVVARIT